jgi:hypothetical protein
MRETTTIEAGEHKFVVKTFANPIEANLIQKAYFGDSAITIEGDKPKIEKFNPTVQFEVNKMLVTQLVVSMDGSEDDIITRCLTTLRDQEFTTLCGEIDELISKKKN